MFQINFKNNARLLSIAWLDIIIIFNLINNAHNNANRVHSPSVIIIICLRNKRGDVLSAYVRVPIADMMLYCLFRAPRYYKWLCSRRRRKNKKKVFNNNNNNIFTRRQSKLILYYSCDARSKTSGKKKKKTLFSSRLFAAFKAISFFQLTLTRRLEFSRE